MSVAYDRSILVGVLVYHQPTSTMGCHCGWNELGKSHPEHVAAAYEESMALLAHLGSHIHGARGRSLLDPDRPLEP